MLGLLQYAANAIVLLLYFILQRPHPFADFSNVAAWPIVAFALFLILHVVAFSVQRVQLVRILLLQRSGVGYDDSLLPAYQLKLTPNWILPIAPLYRVLHVASFALLLFSFGWGVALAAHPAAQLVLALVPTPYILFLPSIRRHLQRKSETEKFFDYTEGFDTQGFITLIGEALDGRRNLSGWWAKLLAEKCAEQVFRERQRSRTGVFEG
jgi:hypothetical protein